jgi:hypothetical protein
MEKAMALSSSGGRYIRSRNRLDTQIQSEKKYAPGHLRGAFSNAQRRGTQPVGKFRNGPTNNAKRRG